MPPFLLFIAGRTKGEPNVIHNNYALSRLIENEPKALQTVKIKAAVGQCNWLIHRYYR